MISQREARRLKKRVEELEQVISDQRNRWSSKYPGGIHIGTVTMERDWFIGRIEAARMMRHAVVATVPENNGKIEFYALPLGDSK